MNKVICVYKKIGETPLDCIKQLRETTTEYKDSTIGYAGRLDPMAEGLLLLLVGDANKNREKYLSLPKVYIVSILLGVETDSYDILGKVTNTTNIENKAVPKIKKLDTQKTELQDNSNLLNVLKSFVGKFNVPYPPFSSKPVSGKPLFQWAKEGRISEIKIPNTKGYINKIDYIKTEQTNALELFSVINKRINKVSGDFRQKKIIKSWKKELQKHPKRKFQLITVRVECLSGTYMRSLAHFVGKKLDSNAIAFHILRESAGKYQIP